MMRPVISLARERNELPIEPLKCGSIFWIKSSEIHLNYMLFLDAPIIDLRARNQQAVFLLGVNDILMSEKSNSNEKRLLKSDNFIEALAELGNESSSIRFDLGETHCYQKPRDCNKILKIIISEVFD